MHPHYSAANSIDGLRRKTVNGETRLAISRVRTILQLSRYSMQCHRFRPSWPYNGTGTGTGSAYCSGMGEHHAIPSANSTAIGTGYQNTTTHIHNYVPNNAGSAAGAYYWSSTQSSDSENANMMQFLNGTWSTDPKSSSHGMRLVRTF